MRSRVRHELKTWPEFFAAVRRGHMKFQLRRDDRPERFQVGDELLLKEWDPELIRGGDDFYHHGDYTGKELLVRVDYVMPVGVVNELMRPRLSEGDFVIMSVSLIP